MLKNYQYDGKPVAYAWNILNSIHAGGWQPLTILSNEFIIPLQLISPQNHR